MVNTFGLKKADVLQALESYAGSQFGPAGKEQGVFAAIIKTEMVIVDLRADDGFSEFWYDRALGAGAAQKAIDALRAGGGERKNA